MTRTALSIALAVTLIFACAQAEAKTRHSTAQTHAIPSSQIVLIQDKLETLGFHSGSRDGLLGPNTRAAIKKYQKSAGLRPSGMLTAETLARLTDTQNGPYAVSANGHTTYAAGAQPIAYFANPWATKPQYQYAPMGMATGLGR